MGMQKVLGIFFYFRHCNRVSFMAALILLYSCYSLSVSSVLGFQQQNSYSQSLAYSRTTARFPLYCLRGVSSCSPFSSSASTHTSKTSTTISNARYYSYNHRYNHHHRYFAPPVSTSTRKSRTALFLSDVADTSSFSHSSSASSSSSSRNKNDDKLFEGLGVGVVRDIRARFPLSVLWSDIKDGMNVQCLAATMFLFFACLAPAVGFGGLFGSATSGAMGVVEMVTSTAVCGILYALLAAQPLTIIGSTGPVLAFVVCLTPLAEALKLPFLPLYAWTGLWTSGFLAVLALTSGSNLVQYLTRFTDEIFSTLISTIFVVEAVSDVARTFSSPSSTFTKALLSLVCATLTYSISITLKRVRQSVLFNQTTRTTLSNFAPTIGVVSACLVARWARLAQGMALAGLPTLSIPNVFGTTSGRPWLVPLLDLPVWARWASFFPAIMATVLLFLDQNITVRLVNNPRWKLTKGRRANNVVDGMHLDLLVVALLTAGQSLLGLPWLVAATVRSLSHVSALSKFDAQTTTSTKPAKVIGTIEQRVTGVAIHGLIFACILFPMPRLLLRQVPLPVLMGLFLYLGATGFDGTEMWERFSGFFKDSQIAPKERWTDTVPRHITNLFTLIQVVLLGAMFCVKESSLGVFFPVIIALLAPIRFGLEKTGIIPKKYMDILDEE